MSLIPAIILTSVATMIVSGEPRLLALNPTTKPDQFGYEIADGLGMQQHGHQTFDSSEAMKGFYGYIDPLGVKRIGEYISYKDGYKVVVKTNEPGTSEQSSANAVFIVEPPPPAAIAQGLKPLLVDSL